MMKYFFTYLLFRLFAFPLEFIPYSWIHAFGRIWGTLLFYLLPNFRKYICSNLACAEDLKLSNEQIRKIAKEAAQNVCITILEYPKLYREKDISKITTSENLEKINKIISQGKGIIFFQGHQANWEMSQAHVSNLQCEGIFIANFRKNPYINSYLLKIRENYGGKCVSSQGAMKEGLNCLKKGLFFSIVGDQAVISSYSSSFLGRIAFTSSLPALLAYKTKVPIVFVSIERRSDKYHLTYSDPIYPNPASPRKEDVKRLMDTTLHLFQKSIKKCPSQWLWQMHKWKQQNLDKLKKQYRYDSMTIILPEDAHLIKQVAIFRKFYPRELIIIYLPKHLSNYANINAEIHSYTSLKECFQEDLRPKLLYNFTKNRELNKHYKKLSVVRTINLECANIEESLQPLIGKNASK